MASGRYDDELKDLARDLRRTGMSVSRIAHELGGAPNTTVRDWVSGIPAPGWTRRARSKDAERERARVLRGLGRTYDEIAAALNVSKSSVSLWTRDLPPPVPRRAAIEARTAGLRRYFAARRERDAQQRLRTVGEGAAQLGALTDRDLLVAGTVAYWAEGTKSKPWRTSERVVFTNSDPAMIALFLRYLRVLGVDDARRRFRVAIHDTADVRAAARFWAELVGIPETDLQRPTLKRHATEPARHNRGDDYHGCLVVGVLRSADLYRRIEGMWGAVTGHLGSTLAEQSRVV